MKRISWLVAAVVILAAGTVHGLWMNRWTPSRELELAAERVPQVPKEIGTWVGKDQEVDDFMEEMVRKSGMLASVTRVYRDEVSGEAVSLLVVCGRSGPISTHTPQACYAASGYREVDQKKYYTPKVRGLSSEPMFWVTDFAKEGSAASPPLRIFYGWAASDGKWEAVEDPRREFAFAKALFKVYVVETGERTGPPKDSDPGPRFLRESLPVINATLFPGQSATQSVAR